MSMGRKRKQLKMLDCPWHFGGKEAEEESVALVKGVA